MRKEYVKLSKSEMLALINHANYINTEKHGLPPIGLEWIDHDVALACLIESEVASRCREQGGNTSDGSVELIDSYLEAHGITQAAANKAEVEPVAKVVKGNLANRLEWMSDEVMSSLPVGTNLYATPPATTGASIDTPKFADLLLDWHQAMPGEESKGAASNLIAYIDQHVARQVAAQAGQVAVPEPVAAAISYWEGPRASNGDPIDKPDNTSPHGWSEWQPTTLKHGKAISERGDKDKRVKYLCDAAPSPAKESK